MNENEARKLIGKKFAAQMDEEINRLFVNGDVPTTSTSLTADVIKDLRQWLANMVLSKKLEPYADKLEEFAAAVKEASIEQCYFCASAPSMCRYVDGTIGPKWYLTEHEGKKYGLFFYPDEAYEFKFLRKPKSIVMPPDNSLFWSRR